VPRLGTEAAKALYVALRARPTRHSTEDKPRVRSDSEHQACLAAARRFGDWLVKERIWTSNPIAEVAPVGRPKAGEESKVQLRRDEAVLWLAEAKRQAQEGQVDALAAAACFVGALRVSEVLERQVRDLEDQARCLFVPKSKSRAGRRRVPMRPLAELLRAQVVRAAAAPRSEGVVVQLSPPLFPELDCYAVRRAVHRICRAAGVPIITTHALRGTMISLAAAGGEALGAIADDVGHASEAVTRRSYATADAQTEGALARGMARLAGEGA
jgi:integrase